MPTPTITTRLTRAGRPFDSTRLRRKTCVALRRPGTAATEFAITVPFLLLLAIASCDFGRIVHVHQVVANAARTGAETGAARRFSTFTRTSWEDEVRQAVVNEMSNIPHFNESEMDYNLSTAADADGIQRVTVEVSYPFRTAIAWPALPSEVLLRKQIEFRQFR